MVLDVLDELTNPFHINEAGGGDCPSNGCGNSRSNESGKDPSSSSSGAGNFNIKINDPLKEREKSKFFNW